MLRGYIPRYFTVNLIIIWVVNLGLVYAQKPQHDPEFVAMVSLIEWRDPVTNVRLKLPIDQDAPYYQQILQLKALKSLGLGRLDITELPPEIGNKDGLDIWVSSEVSPAVKKLPSVSVDE